MPKLDMFLSRRHLLAGVSAAGAFSVLGSMKSALAKHGQLPLGDPHKIILGSRRLRWTSSSQTISSGSTIPSSNRTLLSSTPVTGSFSSELD